MTGAIVVAFITGALTYGAWCFTHSWFTTEWRFDRHRSETRLRRIWIWIVALLSVLVTLALGLLTIVILVAGWKIATADRTQVTGEIQRVSSVIEYKDEVFVIVIDEKAHYCDDARCSVLEPGDEVTLSCKEKYESGTNWYDCRFIDSERVR